MRRIGWTAPALADLDTIENYLDQIDPNVAKTAVHAIIEASKRLEEFPAVGAPIGDDVRALPVRRQPYRLVYRVAGNSSLQILRIRHVREDWRAS